MESGLLMESGLSMGPGLLLGLCLMTGSGLTVRKQRLSLTECLEWRVVLELWPQTAPQTQRFELRVVAFVTFFASLQLVSVCRSIYHSHTARY